MDIKPPYGYQEIVPLTKQHRVLLPEARKLPLVFRNLTALPLSFTEFAAACRDYPIAFVSSDGGKSFVAMAVLGLENQQNLFYAAGAWASGVYIPAYARRYPFCMAKVSVNRVERADRLICVEKSFIDDGGESMFDGKGVPSAKWTEVERLLSEYEADLERGREMCSILADYGLLEPFSMQAKLKGQENAPMQVTGMHRVAEKSLGNLNAAQIKNLMRKGILPRIYMHLMSLENFGRLLERKAARQAAA